MSIKGNRRQPDMWSLISARLLNVDGDQSIMTIGRFIIHSPGCWSLLTLESVFIPWENVEWWELVDTSIDLGKSELARCTISNGEASGYIPGEREFVICIKKDGSLFSGRFIKNSSGRFIENPSGPFIPVVCSLHNEYEMYWEDLVWWFRMPQFPSAATLDSLSTIVREAPKAPKGTQSSREIFFSESAHTIRDLYAAANLAKHQEGCEHLSCRLCKHIVTTVLVDHINFAHLRSVTFSKNTTKPRNGILIIGVDRDNQLFKGHAGNLWYDDENEVDWSNVLVWAHSGKKEGHRS